MALLNLPILPPLPSLLPLPLHSSPVPSSFLVSFSLSLPSSPFLTLPFPPSGYPCDLAQPFRLSLKRQVQQEDSSGRGRERGTRRSGKGRERGTRSMREAPESGARSMAGASPWCVAGDPLWRSKTVVYGKFSVRVQPSNIGTGQNAPLGYRQPYAVAGTRRIKAAREICNIGRGLRPLFMLQFRLT